MASQRGGGANGAIRPRLPVKVAPKIGKRGGGTKDVIKNRGIKLKICQEPPYFSGRPW